MVSLPALAVLHRQAIHLPSSPSFCWPSQQKKQIYKDIRVSNARERQKYFSIEKGHRTLRNPVRLVFTFQRTLTEPLTHARSCTSTSPINITELEDISERSFQEWFTEVCSHSKICIGLGVHTCHAQLVWCCACHAYRACRVEQIGGTLQVDVSHVWSSHRVRSRPSWKPKIVTQ